jgi:hypothetical protein
MVTLLGRASAGTGSRETSTFHDPRSGDAGGVLEKAEDEEMKAKASVTASFFIGRLQRFALRRY